METGHSGSMNDRDTTWEHALEAVRSTLRVPSALSTLIRGAWGGILGPKEFMRLLGFPGCNSNALLRAASITPKKEIADAGEVESAVELLGVRASAVMLSINFVCQSVLESAPPERIWTPVLKDMMSEVEIGYHFGLSADSLGCEHGMLIGFSQWAGIAVLLGRNPREFSNWQDSPEGAAINRNESLRIFGCESYQAGSLVLQQLGFGADIATAAAITVGELEAGLVELSPEVATWAAARRWVSALQNGDKYPSDAAAQKAFPELVLPVMCELGRDEPPAHLAMLYENISKVRSERSKWTWHLPKETYEESAREMAKCRSSHGYSTSRTTTLVPS